MSVRVRFAPSPTGFLHVGNARTALVTWLFARAQQGHFLLRIDDTDRERSKPEYESAIESDLAWLGMDWDEKARQNDRWSRYETVIADLKAKNFLYPCYETPEELALRRKTRMAAGKPPVYDRTALGLSADQRAAFESKGRIPHWRFKLSDSAVEWHDLVRGAVRFEPGTMSDPVVIREDGTPLYHLCSVIDDCDFRMTHIVRGEDHVSNTAAHICMFEALGHTPPLFAHLPLLADGGGGKLSKRLGALSLRDLQESEGLEPMAVVSLLARLGTSDPIEPFADIAPLIAGFDFSKFSRGTPKFDQDELLRLNARILHQSSFEQIRPRLEAMHLPDGHEIDSGFWESVRPNLTRLDDLGLWWRVARSPVDRVELGAALESDLDFCATAANLLPPPPWTAETWKLWTNAVQKETGRKGKTLYMPLRQALTGMDHGPELAVLLPLIGYERAHARLVGQEQGLAKSTQ